MNFEQSEDIKSIATKLINKFPDNFSTFDVDQILFLMETTKSPKKYADVKKVQPPYTYITNVKFIITVYEKNILDFSDAQMHALVLHELMHIDENFTKLVKHDLEDFRAIVDLFGSNWDSNPDIKDILEDDDASLPVNEETEEVDEIELV